MQLLCTVVHGRKDKSKPVNIELTNLTDGDLGIGYDVLGSVSGSGIGNEDLGLLIESELGYDSALTVK